VAGLSGDCRGGRPGKIERLVEGRHVDDPNALVWSREFVELLLVQEGFTLTDLRGYEATHIVEEDRTDIAAFLGRVTPHSTRVGAAGAVALGLLLSVETGIATPLIASLGAALVLYSIGRLDEPDPVVKTHKVRRRGLSEREVTDYLTMANKMSELEQEKRENARQNAERRHRHTHG
jgi:hypothetical protein